MEEIKKGYSKQEFKIDLKSDGFSGVIMEIFTEGTPKPQEEIKTDNEGDIENGVKVEWRGHAKITPEIYQKFTPIFFRRHFADLDKETISKVRTFEEIQIEAEKIRGSRFTKTIEDNKTKEELYLNGDKKNKGYLKYIDKKDLTNPIFKKYIPEYGLYIGVTETTKNLLTESPHNYEVFTAVYNLTYRYVLTRYKESQMGETFFHMPIFGFNRIKIKKEDIFNELGWDKSDRWNRMKMENGLYYLRRIKFNLELVSEKRNMELSPFLINYGTTDDGEITFSANETYFRGVEKHLWRKIHELSKGKNLLFKKGELPPFVTEEPFVSGESPECHNLKMILKVWLVNEGKTNMNKFDTFIPVSFLLKSMGVDIKEKDHIPRNLQKLSEHLKELKKSGFISSYSPDIEKGYGRLEKSIRFRKG